jgi:hypothetical protein
MIGSHSFPAKKHPEINSFRFHKSTRFVKYFTFSCDIFTRIPCSISDAHNKRIPGGRSPSDGTPYDIFSSGFTTDFEWVTLLMQFKHFDWLIVARFPSHHFSRLNEWLTFIPSQKAPGNNFVSLHRGHSACWKMLFLACCSDHKHSLHLIPILNIITFFCSAAQKRFTL